MQFTFEQLPNAVNQLFDKIVNIERLLQEKEAKPSPEADELLTVQAAAKFLSLSVPTIYGLIAKKEIPVMKRSKRCYFSKTELINYLKEGRKSTNTETAKAAQDYLKSKAK